MKCQNLFSGRKTKKNISVCSLLKILPRVLSIKGKAGIYHIDLKAILIEE